MPNTQLYQLFHKFLGEEMTPEEINQLQLLIRDEANTAELDELLQAAYANSSLAVTSDYNLDKVYEELNEKKKEQVPVRHLFWKRISVAASILLILSTGAYFMFFNKHAEKQIAKTESSKDISAPNVARATITLANGKQISLDSAGNGTLVTEGNVNVVKLADGQISYNGTSSDIEYNTLTNPRGSNVINLTLSDGSKVWLNAESSLKYPTSFAGTERKVQITGEAYFEVAHNAAMPFIVAKNDVSVQVLGTHFNVNAYDDEATMKITLLEGSVKVKKGNSEGLLKPGQQAQVTNEVKIVNRINIDEVIAWKNGLFSFNKADIKTIMKEVARWYDVDIIYTGDVKPKFYLKASRNISVSNIFKILETTGGVHLEIQGKKIIVKP